MVRDLEQRHRAFDLLLPYQRFDFEGIFRAMDGFSVTIRLLNPPLRGSLPEGHIEDIVVQPSLDTGMTEGLCNVLPSQWSLMSPNLSYALNELNLKMLHNLANVGKTTIHQLIKQAHPSWTPSMIAFAMSTTIKKHDECRHPIMFQGLKLYFLYPSPPFDLGISFINPSAPWTSYSYQTLRTVSTSCACCPTLIPLW